MGRVVFGALGALLAVAGAIWTFQGLGYVEGSPMTGVRFWAMAGPLASGLGVAMAWVAYRGLPK